MHVEYFQLGQLVKTLPKSNEFLKSKFDISSMDSNIKN
jgi:hypothetical protein